MHAMTKEAVQKESLNIIDKIERAENSSIKNLEKKLKELKK